MKQYKAELIIVRQAISSVHVKSGRKISRLLFLLLLEAVTGNVQASCGAWILTFVGVYENEVVKSVTCAKSSELVQVIELRLTLNVCLGLLQQTCLRELGPAFRLTTVSYPSCVTVHRQKGFNSFTFVSS